MGSVQQAFLENFRASFSALVAGSVEWTGGQILANTGVLPAHETLRRGGRFKSGERFELGDLRGDLMRTTLIVEYESSAIAVHNLLKYWPLLRGESSWLPRLPIVMCHFSDWSSYGSHRDLWQWAYERMSAYDALVVSFRARQFDHWGRDLDRAAEAITEAVAWMLSATEEVASAV